MPRRGRGKGNSFIWKSEAEGSSRKALAGVGEHPLNKRISATVRLEPHTTSPRAFAAPLVIMNPLRLGGFDTQPRISCVFQTDAEKVLRTEHLH